MEHAPDFQTALSKLNDYDYDCVLLDIMLPDGNGLTLLQELKKMHKKESVIIISAKDSLEDKVYGLDVGADDYLAKPFHLAELHARVKSVIRRKQNEGELKIEVENLKVYPDLAQCLCGRTGTDIKPEMNLIYYIISLPIPAD